ncbi:hypothetical protein [Ruegeria arenilitoris]|uniref:hypothetical protein n=1 Tax=Ruegeria arenilitoris TaxID=1173585 RepID=UPI00147B8248|nr:hypothetical protein [Ruegeria arenilitoris]
MACAVCVTLPEYSLADRILSAQVMVLAAPAPDNPFSYSPVSVLKGTPEQLAVLPDIPFLVDSVSRSAFRTDPDRTVLMIYGGGVQDKAGRGYANVWSKSFLMTPDRTAFLDAVRARHADWSIGKTDDPTRVAFFSRFLTHEDRILRNAALIEIHRAPYPIARQVRDVVPTAHLMRDLRDVNRLAYAPTIIRLLGLQSDPEARALVQSRYRSALQTGSLNLTDWALAGIEVDGAVAVDLIGNGLAQQHRTQEDRQKLIQVLTDGGAARPELQAQILEIYRQELESSTSLAGWIALSVDVWGTGALTASLQEVLARDDVDPVAAFLIQNVLGADNPE